MADNTTLNSATGGDIISSDQITTLNGAGIATGEKAQRVKIGFGADSFFTDASSSTPLPMVRPNTYTTGTISAANANTYIGAATANSTVQVTVPDGQDSWDIYVSGTFSAGTELYTQGSLDGTNWFSLNGRRNTDPTTNDTTNFIASNFIGGPSPTGSNPSNYRGSVGAIRFFRVSCFTYTAADSISVQLCTSAGGGPVFLNHTPQMKLSDSTTTGTMATIKAASTAAVATDTGLVVTIHPSSGPMTAQPVTGTFFQATQPVSGTFFQTTQPVSGTFFQATQPVSIAAAVAVTGTFFQTTQPVSLAAAVTVAQATAASLNATVVGTGTFAVQAAATLAAETTKVIGTVNFSAGQTVATVTTVGAVTAITNALPTGANTIGSVKLTDGTTAAVVKAASTASVATDPSVVVALSPNSPVQQAALTKGTQGATGVTTQDLKDAGRVSISVTTYRAAGIPTTEALFAAATFSNSRDAATATTGVQFTVTAGKRFRIQSIECSIFNNAAAACTSKLVLRGVAAAGTITNASPPLMIWDIGSNSVTTGQYIGPMVLPLPDGFELLPGYAYGFTNLSSAATVLHTISLNGYEY